MNRGFRLLVLVLAIIRAVAAFVLLVMWLMHLIDDEHDIMAPGGGDDETIVVTGSSGLIGAALVDRLAERYCVVGFDLERPLHPPPAAES